MQDKTAPKSFAPPFDEAIQSVKMAELKLEAQLTIDKGLKDIFISIQAYNSDPSNKVIASETNPVISPTIKVPKL